MNKKCPTPLSSDNTTRLTNCVGAKQGGWGFDNRNNHCELSARPVTAESFAMFNLTQPTALQMRETFHLHSYHPHPPHTHFHPPHKKTKWLPDSAAQVAPAPTIAATPGAAATARTAAGLPVSSRRRHQRRRPQHRRASRRRRRRRTISLFQERQASRLPPPLNNSRAPPTERLARVSDPVAAHA